MSMDIYISTHSSMLQTHFSKDTKVVTASRDLRECSEDEVVREGSTTRGRESNLLFLAQEWQKHKNHHDIDHMAVP